MSPERSRPRRAPRGGRRALVLACLLLAACRSQEREEERAERERLTAEMFQELVQQGTLTPVTSMEDPFSEFRPEMGATPEDYGRLGGGEAAPAVPDPDPPRTEAPRDPAPIGPPPQSAYQRFGARIIVHEETGLITKPYPMRTTAGASLYKFLTTYADFPFWNGEGVQPPDTVYVESLTNYDVEFLSDTMRKPGPAPGKDVPMGDWLVVTAGPDLLAEVEAFIDTFAGGPPQIEIEAKIVEWVVRESLDLGVQDVSAIFPPNTLVSDLGWDFPNAASIDTGGEFFAGISSIHDGVTYAAMFEAMAAYDNVSIISRPKVSVREGVKAELEAITRNPYLKVTAINNSGNASTQLDYLDVGVQLYVTPRLVGTRNIALQIDIEASQQTGNAVTFAVGGGATVSTPVLSTRSAETLVYLKPGQAVILGGLITERVVEEERGIPLLKDLPLVGYLFKSTYEQKEEATLLFFIRPRLIEGTDLNQPF
jgi:type II secretory pathway component GspD/PulD (secretin)